MNAEVFIDTNILLYSIEENPVATPKCQIARELLLTESWGWSIQVASEFFVNATSSKRQFRLSNSDAKQWLDTWLRMPTMPVTVEVFLKALSLQSRFSISYWDAAILAAAKLLGCHTVYSEDLNHGQNYEGVRVVNPFFAT